jgi:anti-anti-sigma regulatory factor
MASWLLDLPSELPAREMVTVLRITRVNAMDDSDTLKLEGRIAGPWVDELARLTQAPKGGRRLVLDVTDVSFADDAGVRLLRDLADHQAELRGASMFLAGLMGGDRDDSRR